MKEKIPNDILQLKLDEDFTRRGLSGCFFFAFIACLMMYLDWVPKIESLPKTVNQILVGVLSINIIRYIILKRILNGDSRKYLIQAAKTVALVNPMLWAAIFGQIIWIDRFQSASSLVVVLLTAGFSVGATMTLAAAQGVIFIYQIILQYPIIWGGIHLVINENTGQAYLIGFSIITFLFYNVFQAITIRKQLISTIASIYFLEESKKELEESQKKLKEESAKVVHSSRLASLGEMAGGVAHEINNPLAVLTLNHNSLQKLLLKYKEQADEAIFTKLEKIGRSITRINTIVSGLRSFSQTSDQLPFESTTIQRILQETMEFCNEKIKLNGIDFKITGDTNIKVHARPIQISQILLNLLNNAIHAVKDTPKPKIILDVTQHNSQVYIEVTDSGLGVPENIKQKLFQPFVTTKDVGSGTGLGLSVSRGIAREHRGDLNLLNDTQQTTFRLELPIDVTNIKEQAA